MSIVTKTGDKGETGLLSGERVSKTDPRVEAYGTLDELVSLVGWARAIKPNPIIGLHLKEIQITLFRLGAELASTALDPRWNVVPIGGEEITQLEEWVASIEPELDLPKSFVLPGGSDTSSALDICRTCVRRLERRMQGLIESGLYENRNALRYVNRLSDACFIFARYEQKLGGIDYEPV